ncbi:hypothetical protein PFMG_01400 [Plasmodium falciparum IGH-CR14]|uniref:Uncharacterized protein n=1 Tax=Plasmodium falciparum IGH-CR14 TaxID=580059 RepID=A0A0L1I770_PLAFA|nr:hypothetical protein PFMG_01400 [Plasmodium falciparum IGH-CR14]
MGYDSLVSYHKYISFYNLKTYFLNSLSIIYKFYETSYIIAMNRKKKKKKKDKISYIKYNTKNIYNIYIVLLKIQYCVIILFFSVYFYFHHNKDNLMCTVIILNGCVKSNLCSLIYNNT